VLASFAIHAPTAGAVLFGAAAALFVWAVIADGPLGAVRVVGFRLHRAGLVALSVVVLALPLLSGHLTDLTLLLPCAAAGLVCLRLALVRWSTAGPAAARAAASPPAQEAGRQEVAARAAGRIAGRTGRVVGRQADVMVPRGARIAGRLVARLRSRNPS
jgi:hypothetical protein